MAKEPARSLSIESAWSVSVLTAEPTLPSAVCSWSARLAAVAAADPGISSDQRAALNAGFQSGLSQIQAAVGAAGVDGVNLLDGSANAQTSGGLATYNLSLGGPMIGVAAGANLLDPASAASIAGQLQSAQGAVGQAVSTLSGQADALQEGFISQMQSSPAGFDPGLDADTARLAALQVQQSLSASGGAIGNQSILALFR